jgi:pSer/pThr/pTyr-binding forkhead associated (FHA) protein
MLYILAIAHSPYESKTITLEKGYYTVGRNDANNICLLNKYVSAYHCTILAVEKDKTETECLIIDGRLFTNVKSTNGTWVNGKRIEQVILQHQDIITFSNHEYPRITFYKDITEVGDTAAHEHQTTN